MDQRNFIEVEEDVFYVLNVARDLYSESQLFAFKEKSLSLNSNMFPMESKLLNSLTTQQLSTALLIGYRKKPTKQDLLIKLYQDNKDIVNRAPHLSTKRYHEGILRGIRNTLQILGEDIPGIISDIEEEDGNEAIKSVSSCD